MINHELASVPDVDAAGLRFAVEPASTEVVPAFTRTQMIIIIINISFCYTRYIVIKIEHEGLDGNGGIRELEVGVAGTDTGAVLRIVKQVFITKE